ncbi:MauE/DoxX family redox-associated membrane protein [Nocardia sp. NPDC051981]|uniref:MauE/DoxX family redox-associated membrane protein n=1 Tax=Nocardia sp. NPDC051981 TaxID=3155417 RepID=UPI00342BE096
MAIDYVVWVARLVLAVVFGLSAWGKLADGPGTRKAVGEFGVPLAWIPAVAWALPAVEAVVAVALLPPWTAAGAALVAILLLGMFTGVAREFEVLRTAGARAGDRAAVSRARDARRRPRR